MKKKNNLERWQKEQERKKEEKAKRYKENIGRMLFSAGGTIGGHKIA